MPEPEHTVSKVGEFLQRKAGPLPYWAWGAAGILVIGGTIWMSKHGGIPGLDALTSGGGAGGAGAGGIPPDNQTPTITTTAQSLGDGNPLLIGQQSSFMDGGLSAGGGSIPSDILAEVIASLRSTLPWYRNRSTPADIVSSSTLPPGYAAESAAQGGYSEQAAAAASNLQSGYAAESAAQGGYSEQAAAALSNSIPTTQTQQVQYIPPTYYQQSPPSYNPPAPEPYIAPDITTSQPGTTTTQPGI